MPVIRVTTKKTLPRFNGCDEPKRGPDGGSSQCPRCREMTHVRDSLLALLDGDKKVWATCNACNTEFALGSRLTRERYVLDGGWAYQVGGYGAPLPGDRSALGRLRVRVIDALAVPGTSPCDPDCEMVIGAAPQGLPEAVELSTRQQARKVMDAFRKRLKQEVKKSGK